MGDKQFIDVNPILFRDNVEQLLFGFFRCGSFYPAQAVADAVNVDIDGDGWFSVRIH